MKKLFLIAALFFVNILVIQGCKEAITTPDSSISNSEVLIQKTSSMTNGSFQDPVVINDDAPHWELKVDMPGDGGIVKFEYFLDTKNLKAIKGLTPSFDYNITPGLNLIDYAEARKIAIGVVKGNINEWKLEKDFSNNRWEYRFRMRSAGNNFEIRINALTGDVFRIKN
jgi:hypothetical protein